MVRRFLIFSSLIVCLAFLVCGGSYAQEAEFLSLEIMMDTDADRLLQKETLVAAVRWHTLKPHPYLPENRTRVALVALLYGRILFAHQETRVELFHRFQRASEALLAGNLTFDTDAWFLRAGGMSFPIWPWRLVTPTELKDPQIYTATLIGSDDGNNLRILVKMVFGLERILAPSSALISTYALSRELDNQDRLRLGKVLLAMNDYYGKPEKSGVLLSEMAAFASGVHLLVDK